MKQHRDERLARIRFSEKMYAKVMRHQEMYLKQCIYKVEKAERARDEVVKSLQLAARSSHNETDD